MFSNILNQRGFKNTLLQFAQSCIFKFIVEISLKFYLIILRSLLLFFTHFLWSKPDGKLISKINEQDRYLYLEF